MISKISSAIHEIDAGLDSIESESPESEDIHQLVQNVIGNLDGISENIAKDKNVSEFQENKSALSDAVTKVKKIMRSGKLTDEDKFALSDSVKNIDSFLGAVEDLPDEVLQEVFLHLDVEDLGSAARVSRQFARVQRDVGKGEKLQKVFESTIPKDFEFDQGDYIASFDLRTDEWKEKNLPELKEKHGFALENAKSLDFNKFIIDEDILDFIRDNCPKIKSLTNLENFAQNDFVEHLPSGLQTLKIELRRDIDLIKQDVDKIFKQSPDMKELQLDNVMVDNDLLSKLNEHKNLKILGLHHSSMGFDKEANFLDDLKKMTHLEKLEIPGFEFTEEQVEELRAALPDTVIVSEEEAVEYESSSEDSDVDEL